MGTKGEIIFDKDAIRRAAYSMISNHGQSAARIAAQRADNLDGDDSTEARRMWLAIARTIDSLQRSAAPTHEPVSNAPYVTIRI